MANLTLNNRTLEKYFGMLKGLDNLSKKKLIIKLTESLEIKEEKGEVVDHNGVKMIFNGIIEVNKENKEITYSYPEKLFGIEKESYILHEIDADTTSVTFIQTCTSEKKAKDQEEDQKQLMETLKKKLEEK